MRGSLPGTEVKRVSDPGQGKSAAGSENGFLLDREYSCPICEKVFFTKQVRSAGLVPDGKDMDLRPKYKGIDVMKYKAVMCPMCEYADLDSFFGKLSRQEERLLNENLTLRHGEVSNREGQRDYQMAFERFRSVMRCALIRRTKNSVRGAIALYTAWLLRGWRISLEEGGVKVAADDIMGDSEEKKYIRYSLKYFSEALMYEDFPMAGMNEATFDYLMSALFCEVGNIPEARRYVAMALINKELKRDLRIMAEDLKEQLRKS